MSRYTKRSFLLQVTGFAGASLAAGAARAQSGDFRLPGYSGRFEYRYTPAEDPSYQRGQQQQQQQQGQTGAQTGLTDRDPTDRPQFGRGSGTQATGGQSGLTDRDPTDRANYGRGEAQAGRAYTGVSDQDPSDRPGYGQPR